MRVFWEQTGVLLPIYRLVGQGFLKLNQRAQLVEYASLAA
jgi:hypothetical protein